MARRGQSQYRLAAMDRFTRNYLIVIGAVVLGVAAAWYAGQDHSSGSLNAMLRQDPTVREYPYAFRVKSVRNGVAEIYTPRSAELSALRFVAILDPELEGLPPDDPRVVAAQKELARVQQHVRELVLADPDIDRVSWVSDRDWYERRGIVP